MKKIILKYSLISGSIFLISMIITGVFKTKMGNGWDEIIGFTALILSFAMVYPAMLSYRNSLPDQKIKFLQSLKIGLIITIISCIVYVIGWLVIYYTLIPNYWDRYAAITAEKMRHHGDSAADIKKETESILQYKKPYLNAMEAFLETFPIGVLISLISATIVRLRKK
jgi:hypothetical protein